MEILWWVKRCRALIAGMQVGAFFSWLLKVAGHRETQTWIRKETRTSPDRFIQAQGDVPVASGSSTIGTLGNSLVVRDNLAVITTGGN